MEVLLKEVISNLNEAITFLEKLTKIDKKQKAEKENVLSKLKEITARCTKHLDGEDGENYDDVGGKNLPPPPPADDIYESSYDDLGAKPGPDNGDGIYDDTAEESGQTYDDVGQRGQTIEPIACDKLIKPTFAELLELKKDGALNFLKSPWQKRWCVLKGNILYIYETATDKQQKDAFDVSQYIFQIRDDISKEAKRKERCFELKNDDNQKYEFCASDKEALTRLQAVLKSKTKRGSVSNSLSGSVSETYDDVGGTQPIDGNESTKAKKKGLSFPKWPKRSTKSPSKSLEEENTYQDTAQDAGDIYEETGEGNYDDTARTGGRQTYDDLGRMGDGGNYDDLGRMDGYSQNYDETGFSAPAPPIQDEGGDFYEEYDGDSQKQNNYPPPPIPSPAAKQRRVSTKDDLPPLPATPKPQAGFPTLPPREEIGSASGTFMQRRPPMPIPGGPPALNRRDLPLPPPVNAMEGAGGSLPPPVSDGEFPEDSLDAFGEDKEDYENMYQGMWDCEPDEDNELRFKRGEVVHIISREYENYGWWTAESVDEDIGLVPVSYLMKAYDI